MTGVNGLIKQGSSYAISDQWCITFQTAWSQRKAYQPNIEIKQYFKNSSLYILCCMSYLYLQQPQEHNSNHAGSEQWSIQHHVSNSGWSNATKKPINRTYSCSIAISKYAWGDIPNLLPLCKVSVVINESTKTNGFPSSSFGHIGPLPNLNLGLYFLGTKPKLY